jgi:hypothetical protein
MSNVVPFGTQAWVKIVGAGKLEARAALGYFVGLDNESTGHRIYFPEKRTVKPEREVVYNLEAASEMVVLPSEVQSVGEKEKDILNTHPAIQPQIEEITDPADDDDDAAKLPPPADDPIPHAIDPDDDDEPERGRTKKRANRDPSPVTPPPPRVRPQPGYYKTVKNPQFANMATANAEDDWRPLYCFAAVGMGNEPATLAQARNGPHAKEWDEAYKAEINQLEQRRTWIVVDRPKDKPVIPCRPIFKEKLGSSGEIAKRKARLVAGGH